jgi:hypothetical protein
MKIHTSMKHGAHGKKLVFALKTYETYETDAHGME